MSKDFIDNKLYKDILKNLPVICVDVYIYNQKSNKFLLVKRLNQPESGKFCCPGGRILKKEKILEAVLRKVKQELGLQLVRKKVFFLGVTNTYFSNSIYNNISSHTVNLSFLYEINDIKEVNKLRMAGQESNQFDWFSGQEKNVAGFVRKMIKKIKLNYLNKKNDHHLIILESKT